MPLCVYIFGFTEHGHMNLFIGLSGIYLVLSLIQEHEAKVQAAMAASDR